MLDNASRDGTAEMVRSEFPQARLLALDENVGFAAGVNRAAEEAEGEYLFLLNPDTVVHEGAVANLVDFARRHPEHGLYGGRTLRPNGTVDPGSCWGCPRSGASPASRPCSTWPSGARRVFDPESLGGWQRDSVREVGVVTGCLLLVPTRLWRKLGGFDLRFFMYGEDADLSIRASRRGLRPAITPDAVVTHEVGVSSSARPDKLLLLFSGKATLLRKHWRSPKRELGLGLLLAGVGLRAPGPGHATLERGQRLGGVVARAPPLAARLRPQLRRGRGRRVAGRTVMTPAGRPGARSVGLRAHVRPPCVLDDLHVRPRGAPRPARLRARRDGVDLHHAAPAGHGAGLATALVQRADTEPEHWDSAFWLNVVWCLLLTGVGIATSGLWANLNGEPELKPVVQVLSLLVIAEGLHMVQEAVLQRELRFKRLAIRSNVAAVLGGVTGLVLALNGAGVWALVAQQLVIEFSSVVLIWALSDWRPRLRFSMRHARELLPFSSGVFLSNLGGFLGQRADALLMGIFFGPVAVGIYRLADRFVEVLLEATLRPIGLVSCRCSRASRGTARGSASRSTPGCGPRSC